MTKEIIQDTNLLFNVFITDKRTSGNRLDRLDIFKYSLLSYSVIDRIKKVVIFCELDDDYKSREKELHDFIRSVFKCEVVLFDFSLIHQGQWQQLLKTDILDDSPIMFFCNDDHVFIDSSLDCLYEGIDNLEKEDKNSLCAIWFSHFPEGLSHTVLLSNYDNHPIQQESTNYVSVNQIRQEGIQVFNRKMLDYTFFEINVGDAFLRRTEPMTAGWWPFMNYKCSCNYVPEKFKTFIPLKEIVRHFDGYDVVATPHNYCQPITYHPGFFDKSITLKCYFDNEKDSENTIHITPFLDDNIFHNFMEEDIPLFWRKNCKEIITNKEIDRKSLLEKRNLRYRRLANAPHSHLGVPDNPYKVYSTKLPEWFFTPSMRFE